MSNHKIDIRMATTVALIGAILFGASAFAVAPTAAVAQECDCEQVHSIFSQDGTLVVSITQTIQQSNVTNESFNQTIVQNATEEIIENENGVMDEVNEAVVDFSDNDTDDAVTNASESVVENLVNDTIATDIAIEVVGEAVVDAVVESGGEEIDEADIENAAEDIIADNETFAEIVEEVTSELNTTDVVEQVVEVVDENPEVVDDAVEEVFEDLEPVAPEEEPATEAPEGESNTVSSEIKMSTSGLPEGEFDLVDTDSGEAVSSVQVEVEGGIPEGTYVLTPESE